MSGRDPGSAIQPGLLSSPGAAERPGFAPPPNNALLLAYMPIEFSGTPPNMVTALPRPPVQLQLDDSLIV